MLSIKGIPVENNLQGETSHETFHRSKDHTIKSALELIKTIEQKIQEKHDDRPGKQLQFLVQQAMNWNAIEKIEKQVHNLVQASFPTSNEELKNNPVGDRSKKKQAYLNKLYVTLKLLLSILDEKSLENEVDKDTNNHKEINSLLIRELSMLIKSSQNKKQGFKIAQERERTMELLGERVLNAASKANQNIIDNKQLGELMENTSGQWNNRGSIDSSKENLQSLLKKIAEKYWKSTGGVRNRKKLDSYYNNHDFNLQKRLAGRCENIPKEKCTNACLDGKCKNICYQTTVKVCTGTG